MKQTNTDFRSKVFHIAMELSAVTGKSWPVCLTKAWILYRFTRRMHNEIVTFAYEKADGSLRKAKGTLMDIQDKIKGTGKTTSKTICYYDTEAEGFRSFRIENFITSW